MSAGRLSEASYQQARASRPDASAWVSANAGSGKTYVLVNRIIRLMLAGAPPERILCLTFTRAAAAEMETRLFRRLSAWIVLDDGQLREAIGALGATDDWDGNLSLARRLFTRALETPGGLKIQTLHGFCESVLQRFPVEAGIAPGFSIMDDRTSAELMRAAREHVLGLAAQSHAASPEAKALQRIIVHTQAAGFDDVLTTLLNERSQLVAGWSLEGAGDNLRSALYGELGLEGAEAADVVMAQALAGADRASVSEAIDAFSGSASKTDQARAVTLSSAIGADNWAAYSSVFLTAKGEARSEKTLATKAIKEGQPAVWQWMLDEQARVVAADDRRKAALTADASNALFTLASVILRRFQSEKERRGQLDYDDLVIYTRNLLTRLDAAWVLFRLDGGIDHVLIDEAQDTSPEQWDIVSQLTAEFFAGAGARETLRTLFAVGDHKQSIFSFQGAAPDEFIAQKAQLEARVADAGRPFEDVRVNISFRSTQTVLDAVDHVFQDPLAQKGLADDEILHQANRLGQAGQVELWPLFEKPEEEERDPYDPVDAPGVADPRLQLARHIADTIGSWIERKETLTPRGRAVVPGDILILVRNRTVLADAIVRTLRDAGIPVAGADRLKINSSIAVMDLVALARTLHMPQDDYSLACVLKSPLLEHDEGRAINDDDLLALAPGRKGTLGQALEAARGFARAAEQLASWRTLARSSRPFEFFSQVLEVGGARRRFAERLGAEVNDPLDELLSLASEFERTHPPVLHGFVTWLTDADAEIKRDMEHGKNEVRVMTVHGAKGLESNIVILPDTTRVPDARKVSSVLTFDNGMPVWRLSAATQPGAVSALVQADVDKQREEENRLLYVAMTRARDRLYVGGSKSQNELAPNCWYELIRRALEPHANEIGDGRWRLEGEQSADAADTEESGAQAVAPTEPEDWMLRPAPAEPPEPKPLAPSRLDLVRSDEGAIVELKDQPAASPMVQQAEDRFLRGRLIHRLLQTLPDLPASDREAAAARFMETHGEGLDEQAQRSVIVEVFALLHAPDPAVQTIFAPSSLAEVPITAKLDVFDAEGRPIVISGQIDRLAVSDTEVLIVDFKTNRPPPKNVDDVAEPYIRQLAAYAMALQAIYPGRSVRAWLVWTFDGAIMEVPAERLTTAFT
ncbi:MAG: double-strand break repair helicase AddA [Alphaproteobacteria bacterium]|nr:double-strand break repair helicase AddA [Alphaproteobacteria bacterium]